MNQENTIQICTAVIMEAKAIARRLKLKSCGPFRWKSGQIELLNVGIRAGRLKELDGKSGVLIMAGLAGGLDPALKIADVVIQTDKTVANLFGGSLAGVAICSDCLATATEILATPADKARLRKSSGCVAVDMETQIAQEWAHSRGIRFIAIRAISDTAGETLDPRVANLIDSDGQPSARKIAAVLLRNPGLMKDLSRLKRSADAACDALADKISEAVSKWRDILATK